MYICQMGSAAKIIPFYSYSDYLHWEGRWELIDGLAYAMSPAPVPYHQYISNEIKYAFTKAIKEKKCNNCKVYDFIDIKINEHTIVQPDALIVCKPIIKAYLDFPASLIVEVLSPSTALKDRNNKFNIYELFGVKYYLIVDTDTQHIEIYTLNDSLKYEIINVESLVEIPFEMDDCKVIVNLGEIFK